MRPLFLGYDAMNRPIRIDPDDRKIHMHVIGASGSGKSKFLEWMIRGDLRNRQGFCLLDPHGTLYRSVVNYSAQFPATLPNDVILLNLSAGDRVVGFNPFTKASASSVPVQVASRIAATMHAWGVSNTDQTPTLERTLRLIYTVMLDQNLALPQIEHLIDFNSGEIRGHLIEGLQTPLIQNEWREMQQLRAREWRDEIMSAKNRLFRLLGSPALVRFMGLRDRTLDLRAIMDQGKVLLVNLATSDVLSEEDARVFGALLVNEFFECARRRDIELREPQPYYLYMDEFQSFINPVIAQALAESRKFGLFLILAHQYLAQLDEKLMAATLTNCRIKAVFGGLAEMDALLMAKEMFISKLEPKKIKVAIYQTKFWPTEETRHVTTHTTSHSSASGWNETSADGSSFATTAGEFFGPDQWFATGTQMSRSTSNVRGLSSMSSSGSSGSASYGESESVADIPVFVPVPFQELSSVQYYSLEEQLVEITAALKEQYARHCFIKIGNETEPMLVPKVEQPYISTKNILWYENKLLTANNALPAVTVDEMIAAQNAALLEEAGQILDITPAEKEPVKNRRDDDFLDEVGISG